MQDKSAREALQTFAGGKGDVLLAYENEAITAQKAGIELDYVVPEQTILIQNPAATITESESPDQAKAFLDWLVTPEAQEIYASKGYRSVLPDLVDEQHLPDPADAVHDRRLRRLVEGQRRVLRRREGIGRGHRARPGGVHCRVKPPPPGGCRAAAQDASTGGRSSRAASRSPGSR